jgi:ribose transport system substrate-binding protein
MNVVFQRKLIWVLAVFICLSVSCDSSPTKPAKTKKTLTFITNSDSAFWKIVRKGTEKADSELPNLDVLFKIPFSGKSNEQDRMMNEAIRRDNTDAIAISPIDPESQKKTLNEMAKRVLLITQDSDAPNTDRAFYIGADNESAGRQAGELMKKALPQGGKIMVFVGKRELENSQHRFAGLKEALQGTKVQVLDLLTDNNDRTVAKDNAAATITKHPDIAGMVGLWSYNGPAILEAVKSANKVGKIKIVCFDDETKTLEGIKEGSIFGTVAQQPFEYGYRTTHMVSKILDGDRSVIPETKQVLIQTVVVQKDTVDAFRTQLDQLIGTAK